MIISEQTREVSGFGLEDGLNHGYRDENGYLTMHYLSGVTKVLEQYSKEYLIALQKFYYSFPMDGRYRISFKIERIDDDNQ